MLALSPDGLTVRLPALATAHSHAFQFAMRGTSQRRGKSPKDDFWTWRGQMYRAAQALDRTVGEFHYVHHQPDGTPYADRTILSDAVIAAAKAEGLRVALLRVAYHRAGPGRPAEPGQRRFCDPTVDDVLRDVDALRVKYKDDPAVRVGIAPHSVRAVPPSWLRPLADYARAHDLPFHMHECVAETGKRPVELLAEHGVLSARFVGVHCTNLTAAEAGLLGQAKAFACICATTERDLGDGLPDIGALRGAGVRLCTGIDSHVVTDPIDDLRALETQERLRTRARITYEPEGGTLAEQLWREGSVEGAVACGFADAGGVVTIARRHPSIALAEDENLLDAIVFSGSAGLVSGVEPA